MALPTQIQILAQKALVYLAVLTLLPGCLISDWLNRGEGSGRDVAAQCVISDGRGFATFGVAADECLSPSSYAFDVREFSSQISQSAGQTSLSESLCSEIDGKPFCTSVSRLVMGTKEAYESDFEKGYPVDSYDSREYRVVMRDGVGRVFSMGLSDLSFEAALSEAIQKCQQKMEGTR